MNKTEHDVWAFIENAWNEFKKLPIEEIGKTVGYSVQTVFEEARNTNGN